MATKADLIQFLAVRRFNTHYLPNLTRAQIRTAAQQLSDEQWDAIIDGIRSGDNTNIGAVLSAEVKEFLLALAVTEVTASLADDLLSTTDLLALFP